MKAVHLGYRPVNKIDLSAQYASIIYGQEAPISRSLEDADTPGKGQLTR